MTYGTSRLSSLVPRAGVEPARVAPLVFETPDPYVPNVVRYQLRYIPLVIRLGFEPKTPTLKVLCSTD